MFHVIVDIMAAYDQVGLFIGAVFCLGIGGLVLGNSLYWRVHALRATGTVIGVIARNGTFSPVYRYTLPDGQTHEAKSDASSSLARGKETGRTVRLMISAHDPSLAREAGSYLLDAVGILLIVPGVWLAYTALFAYPLTPATWIMAAVMLVYLAERGHRVFIPKAQRVSIAEWRAQHHLGGTGVIDLAEVQPIEKILATPEAQQALKTQSQGNRKAAPIAGLFAVILLGVGVHQAFDIARLESVGLRAPGKVVRLKGESSSDSGHGYTYHAIIRYRTDKNVTVEFKDSVGSNPPSYRPGDTVTVLYLADNPRNDAIVDRGAFWNWAIPAILLLGAALLGWLFAVLRRGGATASPTDGFAAEARV